VSESFSGMHVADVHFYKRYVHPRQRISDCDRSMGEGSRIYDDSIDLFSARIMDSIDYGTFVVGLEMGYFNPQRRRTLAHCTFDLWKSGGAIDLWFPSAQEVQVWPVDEEDLLLLVRSHCEVMERESVALDESVVVDEYMLDAEEAVSESYLLAGGSLCCL